MGFENQEGPDLQPPERAVDYFGDVLDFHWKYGCLVNYWPTIPEDNEADHRIKLIQDEVDEFKEGVYNKDLVEIADAIGDMLYTAFGAAATFGIPIDEVWQAIHESNMRKVKVPGNIKIQKPPGWKEPDIEGIITRHRRLAGKIHSNGQAQG
jgi:predicted HAD superfamily Cof-like phosphohydrolase